MMVSILGDSISTFEDINPKGDSVFYDSDMQQRNGLNSVYDTWWAKVNQSLRAYLCVNNSYSGSQVTGSEFPSASSVWRTSSLHNSRYCPDLILLYIGYNDFARGIKISPQNSEDMIDSDSSYFTEDYSKMIERIRYNYPRAIIVCGTLMRTFVKGHEHWLFPETYGGIPFEDYNNAIRDVCKKQNCYLADIGALDMRCETLDGSHPTDKGHLTLHSAWIHCLHKLSLI